jgi:hypothetical protein
MGHFSPGSGDSKVITDPAQRFLQEGLENNPDKNRCFAAQLTMKSDLITHVERLSKRCEKNPALLFSLFFLSLAILLSPTLLNPPVWDEAFSIFPAADFLAQHNFDYRSMAQLPGFMEAGPATHGFTLPALYTALVLKLTGGGKIAWCILHLWQWLLGAGIGTLMVRILCEAKSRIDTFLLTALSLFCPLMLTQLGNMYLEVPLLFFSLLALHLFLRNQIPAAVAAGLLACATKETGCVAVIALALTAFLAEKPSLKNLRTSLLLVLPSFAFIFFLHLCLSSTSSGLSLGHESFLIRCWVFLVQACQKYLLMMPDMLVLFAVSTGLAVYYAVSILWRVHWIGTQPDSRSKDRIVFFCSSLVIGFVSFHFIAFSAFANLSNFVSRYLVFILPAMWILWDAALGCWFSQVKRKQSVFAIALLLLLMNRFGVFYPPLATSDIGVSERSGENLDGFRVQKDYMQFLEWNLPPNVPIFHGLPEAFLGQFPVLSYVTKPLTNAIFIPHYTRNHPPQLDRFPDRFYIVYFFPVVGGEQLLDVYHQALGRTDWTTRDVATFARGGFKAFVVLLERKNSIDSLRGEKR